MKWRFFVYAFAVVYAVSIARANPHINRNAAGGIYVPQQATGNGEIVEGLKLILEELKGLRADIQAATAQPDDDTAPVKGKPPSDAATMKVACAKCHTAGTEEGDFTLFDAAGKPRRLPAKDSSRALEQVKGGRMPPPKSGVLAPASKAAIVRHFGGK